MIRVAAAAYPLDPLASEAAVVAKVTGWAETAARGGAEILVFPEYAGIELAAPGGYAARLDRTPTVLAARVSAHDAALSRLAARLGVVLVAGSLPLALSGGVVNRARVFLPDGQSRAQDKIVPTPWERAVWDVQGGGPLRVIETPFARIALLICYDVEFPLLGRAALEAGAELLLVPAATERRAGQSRVRVGAMARALEGQCAVVHAPLIGGAPWAAAVDVNHGTAAIYTPADGAFPETGVLAEGQPETPGWVMADVDLPALSALRDRGEVRGVAHWPEQASVKTVGMALEP